METQSTPNNTNDPAATTNVAPTQPPMDRHPSPAYATRSDKSHKGMFALLLVLLAILVLIALAALVALPVWLRLADQPVLKRNSQNTMRQLDVSQLATAVDKYLRDHSAYPKSTAMDAKVQTLDICGDDCSSANATQVKLTYYAANPTAVSLHAYDKSLVVPDSKTLYIVPAANCKADQSGIGGATSGDALYFVVLYALQTGNGIKQQCLSPY